MIRIVSDSAAPNSVRFIDVETGVEIRGVMDAKILIDPQHINRVVLTVGVESMDVLAAEGYVASKPDPEVSPAEDLAAVFSAESIFKAQTGMGAIPITPRDHWAALRQQLSDIEASLGGMQTDAGANAGACIGLTVDGGYDGVRTR